MNRPATTTGPAVDPGEDSGGARYADYVIAADRIKGARGDCLLFNFSRPAYAA